MKRLLLSSLLVAVLAAIGVLTVKIVHGAADKEAVAARIHTLPSFRFRALDGTAFANASLPKGKPIIIIHFLTTCHFCQGEAREIAASAALRQEAEIVMVSMESAAALERFCMEFGLRGIASVHCVSDSAKTFGSTFGTLATPTTFIYDAQHRLVKQFTGETSAKAMLNAVERSATLP
jgi:peroxiredoxin